MEWFEYLKKIKSSFGNIAFIAKLEMLILGLMEKSESFKFLKNIQALSKLKKIIGIITHPTISTTINTGIGIAVLVGISIATGGVAIAAIGLGFTVLNFVQTIVHATITERHRINIQKELDLIQSAENTHNKIASITAKHPELKFLQEINKPINAVSHDVKHTSENKSYLIHLRKNLSNHIVSIISTVISMNPVAYVMSAISFYLMLTVGARKEIDEQNAKNQINDYLANKKTQYNLPKELHDIALANLDKQAELYALEELQKNNLSQMKPEEIKKDFLSLKDQKFKELIEAKDSVENKLLNQSFGSKVKTTFKALFHVLNPLHSEKNYSKIAQEVSSQSNLHPTSTQNNSQSQSTLSQKINQEPQVDLAFKNTSILNNKLQAEIKCLATQVKEVPLESDNSETIHATKVKKGQIERGG